MAQLDKVHNRGVYLFEAAVHDLKFLAREFGVPTEGVQPFRLVPHNLHLKVVNVMICKQTKNTHISETMQIEAKIRTKHRLHM